MKENDVVEVKKDGQHVIKGEVGTIIHIYPKGSYEVEFDGKIVLLSPKEVKLHKQLKIKEDGKTN